ncbi:SIMPL domain-containing protein [Dactylosporangium sp. NPDC005572]|uniref:SIMPL domain-containing protein n=1 Tax=Dactylosporangium sp. NPDC005572 TaxID=3156889 RepID=UPI0033B6E444
MTTVAVRGEWVQEVEPELAEFRVVVTARDKDRQTTLTRLRERTDALRQLLDRHAEAVERRETSGLYVHPETKRGEKVTAYHGSVTTTVVVHDFAALGELMLSLADQDQTQVHGPTWTLRPDSPVYREARKAAIGEAIARAKEYAATLGAQVTELLELSDPGVGRSSEPTPMFQSFYGSAKARGGGAPDLQLDPERQRVTAAVEARFTITAPDLG